jgi:flagellar basal-body rod modification protein FlgD
MPVPTTAIDNYMGYTTQVKEPSKELDKDAFLKLLVAQLQNQDPSQSQDPQAMMQQMTAFSQLEAMQNVSKMLEVIQSQNIALFQSSATTLVGKQRRVLNAGIELKDGAATIGLDLAEKSTVTMLVKNEDGIPVTTIELGGYPKGHHEIAWDGRTQDGAQLADGMYTFEFQAVDSEGNSVQSVCVSDLRVDSVAFAEGSVLIVAGGKYYSLGDIIEVMSQKS